MDWGLSGLVILSNILIGKKNKWGWIISAVSSVLWIFYAAFAIKQYGLIPASLVTHAPKFFVGLCQAKVNY